MSTPQQYGVPVTVATKAEAESLLAKKIAELHQTETSYIPSGTVPMSSILAMIGATIPGAVAGSIVGILGLIVAELVTRFLFDLTQRICGATWGSIPIMFILVLVPCALLGGALLLLFHILAIALRIEVQ